MSDSGVLGFFRNRARNVGEKFNRQTTLGKSIEVAAISTILSATYLRSRGYQGKALVKPLFLTYCIMLTLSSVGFIALERKLTEEKVANFEKRILKEDS